MSGLADILQSALGGDALSKIAGQLGTDEAGAQKAVGAALPKIIGRMKENADDPAGAAALANAVNKDHDGSLLDNVGGFLEGGQSSGPGAQIMGKVFGGDQSQAQAAVADEAGISHDQAGSLMGMLGPLVMGALGKTGASSGGVQAAGLSGMLGGLLGGGGGGGGLGSLLGGLLSGGGAGSGSAGQGAGAGAMMGKVTGMLDQNKDGSVMDDVQRLAKGGFLQKIMAMFKKK